MNESNQKKWFSSSLIVAPGKFSALLCMSLFLVAGTLHAEPQPIAIENPAKEPVFKLSEEELKTLNLDDKEAQELQQFFDALNNLSPDQKKELEDLGRATEEKMKNQGLDPNNMDDLMKFMETEGLTQPPKKAPASKAPATKRLEPLQKPVQHEAISIISPTDTATMLSDLVARIASLRQKAITHKKISQKLDTIQDKVAQLSFYLNVLRQPDLIKLLTSKEYLSLHSSIESLHRNFATYEPSISARQRSEVINEDDPYEVLNLPYTATAAELEHQFKMLKASRSPEAVEAQLKKEGCTKETCKIPLKSARRTFALIEKSYTTLKDPKKRAGIDNQLSQKIADEKRKAAQSQRAFDQLFSALNTSFSMEQILTKMNQLIEKNKPQEIAQMKAQLELEKKVYERSKQKILVPQMRSSVQSESDRGRQFDSFHRSLAQQRPPMIRPDMSRREGPAGKSQSGGSGEQAEGGKVKADGSKDKSKAKDTGKDKGKDKAKAKEASKDKDKGEKAAELKKEDYGRFAAIQSAGDILDKWKDKSDSIKVTVAPQVNGEPLRSPPQQQEQTLDNLLTRVDKELYKTANDNAETIDAQAGADLEKFFKEFKIFELEKTLKKAAPKPGKALPKGPVADEWAAKIAPHAKKVAEWNTKLSKILDPSQAIHAYGKVIRNNNLEKYGIYELDDSGRQVALKNSPDFNKPDEIEPVTPAGKVNLGKLHATMSALETYLSGK